MKIAYFHQHFSTRMGSTGTRSYEMAVRLVENGHQVTVVCGANTLSRTGLEGSFDHGRRSGIVDGIKVIEFELPYANEHGLIRRAITFWRYAFNSAVVALREDYDVIFATSTPLTAAIPGIVAKLCRRKRFVFEVRDLWPELPKAMGVVTNPVVLAALSALEWVAYRCADKCIALAPGIAAGIKRRAPADSQIIVIPNGCDLDLFGHSAKDPASRQELDIPADAFIAVFAGAHGVANDLDALLAVWTVVEGRGCNDLWLVLIGDGKCKPALKSKAQNLGLKRVRFIEPLPKTRLAQVLQSADVGLMVLADVPAFYEGTSPNKFFDYIASGLPVINNYPGWLAEMILEHDLGAVVPPQNPAVFADVLEQMAIDRSCLNRKGKNARDLAERLFNRDQLAREFQSVLVSW